VPRFFLGALLGYLFYWSGSLWVPILAHVVNNGSQVVLAYLHGKGLISFDITSEEAVPVFLVLISSGVLAMTLFIFKRVSDQHKFIY
jgi:membrane protease YdiL (CAAX protease family)